MDNYMILLMNCVLTWFIAFLALIGYLMTLVRIKEKWTFLILLAEGWFFIAIANTLALVGIAGDKSWLNVLWLASFPLVMVSLLLIFLRVVRLMRVQRKI
jgi:hypothetical protein